MKCYAENSCKVGQLFPRSSSNTELPAPSTLPLMVFCSYSLSVHQNLLPLLGEERAWEHFQPVTAMVDCACKHAHKYLHKYQKNKGGTVAMLKLQDLLHPFRTSTDTSKITFSNSKIS